ncbi:MAG: dolichyl-phosphate-mannose--protein mannosyltransferase [Legionella sp.]|nr:MAG: dolichyl-phosphate-mannose--protein mannosyltransferase [Legionella sp.]
MKSNGFLEQMSRGMFWVLLFLTVIRIVAMIVVPLNDSTEARYAEIARIMVETHDWITPMHQYNVPFWAKPPLSTWLSAVSMTYFGVTPFAARLPALLLSFGVLALVWGLARQRSGRLTAIIATIVLASSLYFYLDEGTVMTDPSLLFSTTLMIVAFWRAVVEQQRTWSYVFFIAMAIGLLAKGPVALILAGMPIGFWVIIENKWSQIWQRLPWIVGTLLMMAIAFPWYYLAEQKTPGFLNYFIMGEHVQRFLQPGWQGDKYGFAHTAPLGMIWIYAFMGTIPWCIPGIAWGIRHAKRLPSLCRDEQGWARYLLLCALTPLVFFTFARNIIYPYVFPSLPAFALLFAEMVKRSDTHERHIKRFIPVATFCGWGFLVISAIFVWRPEWVAKSQDRVIAAFYAQHPSQNDSLMYWLEKTDYSAQFYSAGHALSTLDAQVLCQWLSRPGQHYVVFDAETPPIPAQILTHLTEVDKVTVLSKQFHLFVSHPNVDYCKA